jgi:hypothetical protein
MTMRMAIGINHPAGRSRTFSAHGRRCCQIQRQWMSASVRCSLGWAYSDDLVMFDGDDDCQDDDDDEDNPAHCWQDG